MPKRTTADWGEIRREYITTRTTYRALAAKHRVAFRSVAYQGKRGGWPFERVIHCNRIDTEVSSKTAIQSVTSLIEVNRQHLARSAELRAILNSKLKMRTADGKVVVRESVTIREIARAIMAHGLLFRLDRLALGADADQPPTPRDRFADWTDEELELELQRVRKENLIQ